MSPATESMTESVQRRERAAPAWHRDRARWRVIAFEIGVTALIMVAYFLVRGLRPDNADSAVDRSLAIIHFEQQVGLFQEVRWQEAFLPHNAAMNIANLIYAWGHYPVLLAIALWLVVKDPARFRFVRNVMLVSAVIGIASYWLLPAAPPRLMEAYGYDFGFVDTVHGATSNTAYFQPGPFVNDYAAVPSFHFGWIMLASVAIWVNTTRRAVRAGAVLMSVLMWWAVTVTGNHYFFDMIMGGIVVAASWMFVAALSHVPFRRILRAPLPAVDIQAP
ncbi:MAG: phosphatase PAP2 family protein [Tepidiformaceae bacterium]